MKVSVAVLALALVACGETNFSGQGKKGGSKKSAKAADVKEETAAVPPGEEEAPGETGEEPAAELTPEEDKIQNSTPEDPIDISESGFVCAKDMSVAVGDWSGDYKGSSVGVAEVKGTIDFTMKKANKDTVFLNDYFVKGTIAGVDMGQTVTGIDFKMKCGAPHLKPVEVIVLGVSFTVTMTFTQQSWNPPTLGGTWEAAPSLVSVPVANGTWHVAKN